MSDQLRASLQELEERRMVERLEHMQRELARVREDHANRKYPIDSWQDFKLWIFRCNDHELLLYFIIAVSAEDAVEFLKNGFQESHGQEIISHFDPHENRASVKHPTLGWLTFQPEFRNLFPAKVTPETQYGIIYVLS